MHRCGGHHAKRVSLSKRHQDWAERLIQAGFVVLFRYTDRAISVSNATPASRALSHAVEKAVLVQGRAIVGFD
jgi:hypothetical protein